MKEKDEDFESYDEESSLSEKDKTLFRSLTMRGQYLSQDRPDIAETTKELARYMQDPKPSDMERLKRLGRYLKGRPRGVFIFKEQVLPTSIDIYVDSDHAGCKRTRKTTGGFVAHHGEHVVKIGSQVHSTISLSSGESEFYQLV